MDLVAKPSFLEPSLLGRKVSCTDCRPSGPVIPPTVTLDCDVSKSRVRLTGGLPDQCRDDEGQVGRSFSQNF